VQKAQFKPKGSLDNSILMKKIDQVTEGLAYMNKQLTEKVSKDNAIVIANYIIAQRTEVNCADTYRRNMLNTLISLSIKLKNKSLKEINSEDIAYYLNEFRKPESIDPLHKWIGTYNELRQRLIKFFRWLYYPDVKPEDRKTPQFLGMPKLRRKEISIYKPTDLWTADDDILFLKYCPNKRERCYHTVSMDASARPHELVKVRRKDIFFKTSNGRQYAEITINGKTGTRSIPLINSLPYLKDWLDDHPIRDGNAFVFPSLAGASFGKKLSSDAVNHIYRRLHEEFFPKLLENPSLPQEDKNKIQELLRKPWNPYIRRHSALTQKSKVLRSHILNQHAGWSANSNMAQKYIHYFGNESNESLLQAYGIVPTDQGTDVLLAKQCPNCNEPNKPDSKFCAKCRMVLTYDAYNETLEKQQERESEVNRLQEKYEHDMKAMREEMNQQFNQIMSMIQQNPKLAQIKPEVLSKKM